MIVRLKCESKKERVYCRVKNNKFWRKLLRTIDSYWEGMERERERESILRVACVPADWRRQFEARQSVKKSFAKRLNKSANECVIKPWRTIHVRAFATENKIISEQITHCVQVHVCVQPNHMSVGWILASSLLSSFLAVTLSINFIKFQTLFSLSREVFSFASFNVFATFIHRKSRRHRFFFYCL